MNGLIMTLQLILGLSLLVLIHELGHFLAARAFGIRVSKFYLFFDTGGVRLFRFRIGETEFGMGWLPFGGYCQIVGMIDESLDTEHLKQPVQDWEFRSKPAWQRLIVMFAGIFLNLITGIVILSLLLLNSQNAYLANDEVNKDGIYASEVAREFGFLNGDKILAVNGSRVERFQDVQSMNVLFGSEITLLRGEDTLVLVLPKNAYKKVMQSKGGFIDPTHYPLVIDSVLPGSVAEAMGMQAGDKVVGIDSIHAPSYGFFREYVRAHRGQQAPVEIDVERGGQLLCLTTQLDSSGYVGIYASFPYGLKNYTLPSAFHYGTKDAYDLLAANVKGLGKLFTGEEKASESVQGPIGMAKIYGSVWIWDRFWYVTGIISLILAFMNFLPIPALDGGHILFTLWEIVTRRKPGDKFMMYAQMIGLALLLGLMLFAVGNDLMRIFR